jgi:hypothetical protein
MEFGLHKARTALALLIASSISVSHGAPKWISVALTKTVEPGSDPSMAFFSALASAASSEIWLRKMLILPSLQTSNTV